MCVRVRVCVCRVVRTLVFYQWAPSGKSSNHAEVLAGWLLANGVSALLSFHFLYCLTQRTIGSGENDALLSFVVFPYTEDCRLREK